MGVKTCLWSELVHKQRPEKVVAKNKNAKMFACELWVKRVGIFGVVLYRNQWPVNFILHFAKLHIDGSIRYESTLFKNILSNTLLSKELKYPSFVFLSIHFKILH